MMREPHWCEHPIEYFESIGHAGLMFEFVALRDIQEGEEILINYGQEWQDAWDAHVAKWMPPKYSESYDTCVRAQQWTWCGDSNDIWRTIFRWCLFVYPWSISYHVGNENDDDKHLNYTRAESWIATRWMDLRCTRSSSMKWENWMTTNLQFSIRTKSCLECPGMPLSLKMRHIRETINLQWIDTIALFACVSAPFFGFWCPRWSFHFLRSLHVWSVFLLQLKSLELLCFLTRCFRSWIYHLWTCQEPIGMNTNQYIIIVLYSRKQLLLSLLLLLRTGILHSLVICQKGVAALQLKAIQVDLVQSFFHSQALLHKVMHSYRTF